MASGWVHQIPNTEINEWCRRYANGVSIRQLADGSRYSYGTVRLRLLAAGVLLRSRGGARVDNAFAQAATKRAAKTTGR